MLRVVIALTITYLVGMTSLVESCEYHRMLERLQQQQRRREQEFRRRFGLFREGNVARVGPSYGDETGISPPLVPSPEAPRHVLSQSHVNLDPDPGQLYSPNGNQRRYYVASSSIKRPVLVGSSSSIRYRPRNYDRCPSSYCPVGSQCLSDPQNGQFICRWPQQANRICSSGLKRVNISDRQYKCVDIDECADNTTNDCQEICRNTYRGYECSCGYGYALKSDNSCEDVNECTVEGRVCLHECVNTEGSYICTCPNGYNKINQYNCKDINECENNVCSEGEECLNTYGGHECYSPVCEEGYFRANSTRGSKPGPCVNNDNPSDPDVPFSISDYKIALRLNYPQHRDVGKLRFSRMPGHIYRFDVVEGEQHFYVIQMTTQILIRTQHVLNTPGTLSMKIKITDNFLNYRTSRYTKTTSRVDISFVVSEYGF